MKIATWTCFSVPDYVSKTSWRHIVATSNEKDFEPKSAWIFFNRSKKYFRVFRRFDYLFSSIERRVITENGRVTTVVFAVLKGWVNLQKVSGSGENLFSVKIKNLKPFIEKIAKILMIKIL